MLFIIVKSLKANKLKTFNIFYIKKLSDQNSPAIQTRPIPLHPPTQTGKPQIDGLSNTSDNLYYPCFQTEVIAVDSGFVSI